MKRTAKQWETDYNHAKALALKCAAERDMLSREAAKSSIATTARIEALRADLRTRTEERDAAQLTARQYAETRKLADDVQAELAAVKIALAAATEEAQQWANNERDAVECVGVVRGKMESLALLVVKNKQGAHELAEIILAESKPCAT